MAEGGQDEDSGDVMLAGAAAAAADTTTTSNSNGIGVTATATPATATKPRELSAEVGVQQPIALNIKSEVCTKSYVLLLYLREFNSKQRPCLDMASNMHYYVSSQILLTV